MKMELKWSLLCLLMAWFFLTANLTYGQESDNWDTVSPPQYEQDLQKRMKRAAQVQAEVDAKKDEEKLPEDTQDKKSNQVRNKYSDFVDTRLTFILSDDNILAGAGDATPSSPAAGFYPRSKSTQPMDNLDTKYSGFETLSHLVLYRQMPTYYDNLTSEAAFAIRFLLNYQRKLGLAESGSYIRLKYQFDGPKEYLGFTAFPYSSDRFRLGYSYRISWAGSSVFKGVYSGGKWSRGKYPVPGFKLEYHHPRFYLFTGMKATTLYNDEVKEEETVYGFLAGTGVDILDELRLEGGVGFFQLGVFPNRTILGKPFWAGGGSFQLVYHVGIPIKTSIDFNLYKNDPEQMAAYFKPQKYNSGFSWSAATEFSYLMQNLEDADNVGSTKIQSAMAFDFNIKFRHDFLRLHADLVYRTVSFMLFNVPGVNPYESFSAVSGHNPDIIAAAGVDYHFPSIHFTPGLIFGIQIPATSEVVSINSSANPPGPISSTVTVVYREDGARRVILPDNQKTTPIYAVKLTGKFDLSEYMAFIAQGMFTVDNNEVRLVQDALGIPVYHFQDPYILGFNLVLQARF